MLHFLSERVRIDEPLKADYKQARATVQHLMIVNDNAERGVALMQEYNALITKNEDQKQYLLQVLEQHRHRYPNRKKTTLISNEYSECE
ncbi:hypothetical protein PR048_001924 [Dryococelus australis]|uniref:Uncharacterized protein n=1 Tax=Dryococelus australis TaxID=614101 RepID=A0ABQ9IIQ3_9NEOP|nr:hypothetical protein PR048_001924 [Dryococelus australis]